VLTNPQELGYPGDLPIGPHVLPPGGGKWQVPNPLTYQSYYNAPAHVYRWAFDQALVRGLPDALAMRNDPVIYECVRARQMPVAGLSWHIDPADDTDPLELELSEIVTEIVKEIPRWQQLVRVLDEAIFYGRYGVQLAWDTSLIHGVSVPTVRDWVPVNGDKLRFRYDGTVGILVHALYPGSREVTDHGLCHFLSPEEREGLIVHEFEPEDADFSQAQFAGQVHGVGLRSRLYWPWYFKKSITGLLFDYLQRFSQGLTLWKYPAHNPQARLEAEKAAAQSTTNPHVFIPVWNLGQKDEIGVERLEVGTASPQLLQALVTDYYDGIFRLTILGQELSSTTAPTGLGSGVATAHMETLSRVIKYDATDLSETINRDLVRPIYRRIAPGVRAGKFVFEVDEPNAQEVIANAEILKNEFQAAVDVDHLMDVAKLPAPKGGSQVASQIAPMQPAAVGGVPQGVPIAGAAMPPSAPAPDPSQLAYRRWLRGEIVRLARLGRRAGAGSRLAA